MPRRRIRVEEVPRLLNALRLALDERDRLFQSLELADERVRRLTEKAAELGSIAHAQLLGQHREMWVAWRQPGGCDRKHENRGE